jgi:hypothetical protein
MVGESPCKSLYCTVLYWAVFRVNRLYLIQIQYRNIRNISINLWMLQIWCRRSGAWCAAIWPRYSTCWATCRTGCSWRSTSRRSIGSLHPHPVSSQVNWQRHLLFRFRHSYIQSLTFYALHLCPSFPLYHYVSVNSAYVIRINSVQRIVSATSMHQCQSAELSRCSYKSSAVTVIDCRSLVSACRRGTAPCCTQQITENC